MTKMFFFIALALLGAFGLAAQPAASAKPHIQIALLLDTSNSMDGLIDQAKSQLWKMVNELASTKKNGQAPDIEIALFEYGNDGLSASEGYIRMVSALSTDLDMISEKLFALSTNGGSEYCGWVIEDATEALGWSPSPNDLKIIIIAGNEDFAQGPKAYQQTCAAAIKKGIQINSIFCGGYEEGVSLHWKEGADMADGRYLNIDTDARVVHIPTPFDEEILRLNQDLNGTYIGYGDAGAARMEMQAVQDANAASYGAANLRARAAAKSKESYSNAQWDLVDAVAEDASMVESIEEAALPAELQGKSEAELKAYVDEMGKKREQIRQQILEMEQKANAYVAEKRAEAADGLTLDNVMMKAIREQAEGKGFKIEQ